MTPSPTETLVLVVPQGAIAGSVQRLSVYTVSTEPSASFSLRVQLSPTLHSDALYDEQVHRAGLLAERIIHGSVLSELALGAHVLEIALEPAYYVEQSSHGLSLLLLILAHVLDLHPDPCVVFSAALQDLNSGSEIGLGPVEGVANKLAAARAHSIQRLYYFWTDPSHESSDDMRLHRSVFAEPSSPVPAATPHALPSHLSWANLFNLANLSHQLWDRLLSQKPGATLHAVSELLAAALDSPAATDEYPLGLGSFIAGLRAAGVDLADLPDQLSFSERLSRVPRGHLADFLKLGSSSDPSASPEDDLVAWCEQTGTDLSAFGAPLLRALAILAVGEREGLLLDPALSIAVHALKTRISQACTEPLEPRLVAALVHYANALGTGRRDVLHVLLNGVAEIPSLSAEDRARLSRRISYLIQPPSAVQAATRDYVTLRFERTTDSVPRQGAHDLLVTNQLRLTYAAPDNFQCTLDGPVLLWERSRNLPAYCRRRAFREADDTSARLPFGDAQLIHGTAGDPCRIEFLPQSAGESSLPVGVFWMSWQEPFPPAIDAQFFAATLDKFASHFSAARSLIDIGCGTGYLAVVASHLLPTLNRVLLYDQRITTTEYALDAFSGAIATPAGDFAAVAPCASILTRSGSDLRALQCDTPFDLGLCNPPYLPELHLAASGLQSATNGTELLRQVITEAPRLVRRLILSLSTLAWPEFDTTLAACRAKYKSIRVLSRALVPLRVPPILPEHPSEKREDLRNSPAAHQQYRERLHYFESVLLRPQRGLIDLDADDWEAHLRLRATDSVPRLRAFTDAAHPLQDESGWSSETYRDLLQALHADSRGFRHWHEIRVLLLEVSS